LIFVGFCMVNGCHGVPLNEAAMGISAALWRTLMLLAIIVLWNRWPDARGCRRWRWAAVRAVAAAALVYLLAVYRADLGGEVVWLRTRWWGIVGLIGWAYLVSAFVWLGCREHGTALSGALALLVAVQIGSKCGALHGWPDSLQGWLPSPGDLAGLSSMTVAGMVVATLLRPPCPATTPRSRIAWMLVFAAGFVAAGLLLRPLGGIHKDGCTSSWALCSVGIACAIYAVLYWLIDVKGVRHGMLLVEQAGSNTLLMYLLPSLFYSLLALLGVDYLKTHFCEGWSGIARAAALAACFVAVTALLTRCRVRLRL
jgi:predicted acyltransferase